jgi:hypothetical protein
MDEQAKEIKNKVMCEMNSFAIVYFFFDDRQVNDLFVQQFSLLYHVNFEYQKCCLGLKFSSL